MEMRKIRTENIGKIAVLNGGYIRGYVTLYRCEGPFTKEELIQRTGEHCIPPERINSSDFQYFFGWMLKEVEKLPIPEKYNHPRGAQSWVNLN